MKLNWFGKKSMPSGSKAGIDPNSLLPRIKHKNFIALLKQQGLPDEQMPVTSVVFHSVWNLSGCWRE